MVGYVTLGTKNFDRSVAFYDELLAVLGAKRGMQNERFISWGTSRTSPALCICKPYDKKEASVGNGTMVALNAGDTATVDAFYAKALALGATDEGPPGPRAPGYYVAYVRDQEGNKINAFCAG